MIPHVRVVVGEERVPRQVVVVDLGIIGIKVLLVLLVVLVLLAVLVVVV